ncbi:hypothetical protein FJTKL_07793 [Diaporthe vaccinii]|uniref:Uncharacterized protein n=1 Tax=Diaporthe vaccinii TaxID=105482 RepID=A0ABR4FDC6_9PEZI
MAPPKRLVKLRRPGRKGATHPSEDAMVDPSQVDDRSAALATGSKNTSQQFKEQLETCAKIKEEPSSNIQDFSSIGTPSTVATTAGNDSHNETNEIESQQSVNPETTLPQKRNLETSENEVKPVKRPKLTDRVRQVKDAVMKESFSKLRGNTIARHGKSKAKDLPTLGHAPAHLKKHLQNILDTALQLPDAKKSDVTRDVLQLAAMAKLLGDMVQPWVSPESGPKTIADYKWLVRGMAYPLHHHQLIAVGTMLVNERDSKNDGVTKFALRSGFLFDYMGLGKTPETLGCTISNPPNFPQGKRSKTGATTTLVVVPCSAASQWEKEVRYHCPVYDVKLYDRKSSESCISATMKADILIVTYEQLHQANAMGEKNKSRNGRSPGQSVLFQANFYRLIADEAHRFKNRETIVFSLCCKLKARHRWCLTGTPTPNGLHELYSYLKFIRHPLVLDFIHFKNQYLGGRAQETASKTKPNKNQYEALDRLLEPIMFMRNPDSSFLGSALVDLPKKHVYVSRIPLNTEERIIQKFMEDHIEDYVLKKLATNARKKNVGKEAQNRSRKKSTTATSGKMSYKSLTESALRFRQLVASPLLLEKLVKDGIWTPEQVRLMRDQAREAGCAETPFIDQFSLWLSEPKFPSSSHGNKMVQRIEANLNQASCPVCNDSTQENPHMSRCGHIYCKKCVDDRILFCKITHKDIDCSRCKRSIGSPTPCELSPQPWRESKKNTDRPRLRGDDWLKFQPQNDVGATLIPRLDANPKVPIPLSSKMKATIDQIQAWQESAPDDKVIVFTQFIDTQRLLGRVLQDLGIEFLYFVGEMNREQRENAKTEFSRVSSIKVLIISLQCGGEALNLQMANRVIIAEPWWNQSTEMQAICRVYRLGQRKEVYCLRLLADETIDSRMYKLQELKLSQIKSALDVFQADKAYGIRALRRVLGARFQEDGDEKDENLFEGYDYSEDDDDTTDDEKPSDNEDPNDGDYKD